MPYRLRNILAVVTLLGIVACDEAPSSEPSSPLHGVWSMTASDLGDGTAVIDPSQPGIYIFAAGYYSGVYAPLAGLRVAAEVPFQPTDEEKVAQYASGPLQDFLCSSRLRQQNSVRPPLFVGHPQHRQLQ